MYLEGLLVSSINPDAEALQSQTAQPSLVLTIFIISTLVTARKALALPKISRETLEGSRVFLFRFLSGFPVVPELTDLMAD